MTAMQNARVQINYWFWVRGALAIMFIGLVAGSCGFKWINE